MTAGGRSTRAPEELRTVRLVLRRPVPADAGAILSGYASDAEVTRFLGWPRHTAVEDSLGFVRRSDEVWSAAPAGPYVILDRDGELLGSTGLEVETPWRAATGYVLARAAWGQGYGTEVAAAMVELAAGLGLSRLYALCHPANRRSVRVLERAGYTREGVLARHSLFPNLGDDLPQDVESWAHTW